MLIAAVLTIGVYAAVSALTNDEGPSESPSLTRTGVSPWQERFASFGSFDPTATPGVARVAVIPVPTPAPTPAPTEVPTPVPPPPVQPVDRAPAVIPEPEPEPPPPPPPPPPAGGFRHDIAGGIAAAFNDVRAQNGLGSVSGNGSLNAAAQAYAEFHYLNYGIELSHSYDGTPGDRAARNGYSWSNIGEVIAAGGTSAQDFVSMWLNSPGHRDIVLSGAYADVGVGCYEGAGQPILCVAVFGAPL